MASRLFRNVNALGTRAVLLGGSFAPIVDLDFSPSDDSYGGYGPGWTASRDGVGLYKVTLDDNYVRIEAAVFDLYLDNPQARGAVLVAQTLGPQGGSDGKTVAFRVANAATNAAVELQHNDRVQFVMLLDNSTVVDRKDSGF